MAQNYAQGVPLGRNNTVMTGLVAPVAATITYVSENATASSIINLTSMATAIEITVVGGSVAGAGTTGAAIKWIKTTDTQGSVVTTAAAANFDHFIPAGQYRRFVVPIEGNPNTFNQGTLGPNLANGLYQRIAWKTVGNASILATEF